MLQSSTTPNSNLDMRACFTFVSNRKAVQDYLRGNFTVSLANTSAVIVRFSPLETNQTIDLFSLTADEDVRVDVATGCLRQRVGVSPVNFTFVHRRVEAARTIVDPAGVKGTKDATEAVQVVAMSVGGGAMATQVARSTIVLGLVECSPEFYSRLGFMQNPFQVSIGPEKYGQYVGSAILNQVLIFGIAGLHLLWAYIEMRRKSLPTFKDAMTEVRFPSLSTIPLMFFVEPTCMAAVVTITYGEGVGFKVIGCVSLLLSLSVLFGMLVYIKKSWAAEMVQGERPSLWQAKKRVAIGDDDDVDRTESSWRTFSRRLVGWFGYFIDGGIKWKDHEGNKGYCRRNRLIFMDCTGKWHWFTCAEMIMAGVCGILDGIKLGLHQCNGIVIALICILLIFFLMVILLRPYNAPFLLLFSIAVTAIQLAAAICMGVTMLGDGDDSWQEAAELLTLVGIYIIIGRAIFDIIPKFKQLVVGGIKQYCHKKAEKEQGTHADLTQRLLEVVAVQGVEEDLHCIDHDAAAAAERAKADAEADDELPEIEFDDVDPNAWPEYDFDEELLHMVPAGLAAESSGSNQFSNALVADNADDTCVDVDGRVRTQAKEEIERHALVSNMRRRQMESQAQHVREEYERQKRQQQAELDAILDGLEAATPAARHTRKDASPIQDDADSPPDLYAALQKKSTFIAQLGGVQRRDAPPTTSPPAAVPAASTANSLQTIEPQRSTGDADLDRLLDDLEGEPANEEMVEEAEDEEEAQEEEEDSANSNVCIEIDSNDDVEEQVSAVGDIEQPLNKDALPVDDEDDDDDLHLLLPPPVDAQGRANSNSISTSSHESNEDDERIAVL